MAQDIIEAPKVVEGEVLTDKEPNTEAQKLLELIAECDEAFETILEVAQRIDHGMTDVRPNKPNREIVRVADSMLTRLRGVAEELGLLEDQTDNQLLLEEGNEYGS